MAGAAQLVFVYTDDQVGKTIGGVWEAFAMKGEPVDSSANFRGQYHHRNLVDVAGG